MEGWPEVPLVSKPASLACRGERLAGARPAPDGGCGGDSCKLEGEAPSPDPCEEVALCVSFKFIGSDILDRPFIHHAGRNQSSLDELPEPCCGERVVLVVVIHVVSLQQSLQAGEESSLQKSDKLTLRLSEF